MPDSVFLRLTTRRIAMAIAVLLWFVPQAGALTYTLRGTTFEVDTLFHASIGPGTTQTSLRMTSGTRQMNVFYARIDLTDPYVTLRTVMADDRFAGTERVSAMAQRKSGPGERYFLGINGDFFLTSGTTGRGESLVGVPCGSCMADAEVYRGQTNSYYTQFAFDADKKPAIGSAVFGGSVTAPSGLSAPLAGINADAPDDALVLYNPRYFAGTNQYGTVSEVQVRLAEGHSFAVGHTFDLVVTGEPSRGGDLDIPADGYVLHGQGSTLAFVDALRPGDRLSTTLTIDVNGSPMQPVQMISGFPKSIDGGVVTDTEWMLDEFSSNQPVTELGIADQGRTIIMIVIDGRSPVSSGCRTTEVADLLRQLGATEAINFDSGGSTTFYTAPLGIRNRPSDGSERADCNGIFAVCTAPDDSVVSSISFVDWAATLPVCGVYKPKFYGYNRYGMLIDTDLRGVVLDGLERLGEVRDDGTTFVALHSGTGTLTAHYGEITAGVPLTVVGSTEGLSLLRDSVLVDGLRPYEIELVNTVGTTSYAALPALLQWTSDDETVATVDAAGVVRGVADGRCTLTGRTDGFECVLPVTVEIPRAAELAVPDWAEASSWSVTQSGAKNGIFNSDATGLTYSYTASSSRAPKVVFTGERRLYSIPDSVVLTFAEAMSAPVSSIQVGIRPANGRTVYVTEPLEAGVHRVALAAEQWATDRGAFPLTLVNIQFNLSGQTVGQAYTLGLSNLACIYPVGGGVYGDVNADGVADVSDLNLLINMVLGLSNATPSANLNADDYVDVSDVNLLINTILKL